MTDTLREAIGSSGPILLDFDGPICGVFENYSAWRVAAQLRDMAEASGATIPEAIQSERDPLAVLSWSATVADPSIASVVESTLIIEETKAVRTAQATPGVVEILRKADRLARPLAVVSNNSSDAINVFLKQASLDGYVWAVIGRRKGHPELMKPHPYAVLDAADEFSANPADCVFVGDSLSDIEAGRAAGVRTVGFANRAGKFEALIESGADAVTWSMQEIADCL